MSTTSRFNLIDEAWIPVRFLDGRTAELGIRDTLLQAPDIAGIEDASPLVVAALHRFLLAVLYRALQGPTDIEQAKTLFKAGLPGERISAYLEHWRQRFWLFDEKNPFGQIPTFEPKTWRAWTVLAAEHNADNAKVLFDHIDVSNAGTISPAAAVRWMLATQTFSISCGKSELAHTGTAPAATAAMVLPQGANLQDTLLFALVPQNREVITDDIALWEREPETVETLKGGRERAISGLADRYTWRTRAIRLQTTTEQGVGSLAFASGIDHRDSDQPDPMLGYWIDEKKGKQAVKFHQRGFWRDFDSLLPDATQLAPQVIEHAIRLSKSEPSRFPRAVMVLGQANKPPKANLDYWRMERFTLPEVLAGNRYVRTDVRQMLTVAEEVQKSLWLACKTFARNLLSRGEREPAKNDISNFVSQMPASGVYWSALESRFHRILNEYKLDRDPEDIQHLWLNFVRDSFRMSWGQFRAGVSTGDAWAIRALEMAEQPIRRQLKALNDEIEKFAPNKEPA